MAGYWRLKLALALVVSCIVSIYSAVGPKTVNYTYTARDRLVLVSHSRPANDGVEAFYSYDRADNRTNVTVSRGGIPSFTINGASATEGGTLVFTVTKTGSTSGSFIFNYARADETVTAGTLAFAPSDTSMTISVAAVDDAAVEGSEAFVVPLSGATGGATTSASQGTGTIADNDSLPPPSFVRVLV